MTKKPEIASVQDALAFGANISRTEIVSIFSQQKAAKKINVERINSATPAAAVSSVIGSASCGKRSLIITPEVPIETKKLSFMRLPAVIAKINSKIMNDYEGYLDSGCIVFSPSNNQEIIDMMIYAYRVAEDNNVLLPAVIIADGIDFMESVIVDEKAAEKFLPKLKAQKKIDSKVPISMGVNADDVSAFKAQQQKAMVNAAELMKKTGKKFKELFKRDISAAEKYMTDDAETIFVMTGFQTGTAKASIDKLRQSGEKVGLLILKMIRPWNSDIINEILKNAKKAVIIDTDISLGSWGILYREIKTSYTGLAINAIALNRHFMENDFIEMNEMIKKTEKPERIWL